MISAKINYLAKDLVMGMLAITMFFSMTSCSKKISFLTSNVVPAARGTVNVKSDDNNNHVIKLDIINLAEPDRLQPPKKMYMVWMVTDQDVTKNIGQIKTSTGTFSKTLKASFETVTTFKPVKIFITAEDDSDIQSPGWEVVLTTDKFNQ
jgi:hypothetical protein